MIDLSSEEAAPRSGAGLPWWTATGEQVEAARPGRGVPEVPEPPQPVRPFAVARLLVAVLVAYLVAWLLAYAALLAILRATGGG